MGMRVSPELEAQILARASSSTVAALPPASIAPPPEIFESEAQFQAAFMRQAREWGWFCYHTYDSRRSDEGFPDVVMLRRNRMIVVEAKRSRKEKPSPAQRKWLRAFQAIPGCEVGVWSPEDWDFIIKTLS